jgi:hypothetical protein
MIPWCLDHVVIRSFVTVQVLVAVACDLYRGLWENASAGVKLVMCTWMFVFVPGSQGDRQSMKTWSDVYVIHRAAVHGGGASTDVTRGIFSTIPLLLIPVDSIEWHEFARTFQALFRYIVLLDQPEFMENTTSDLSPAVIQEWGAVADAAFVGFRGKSL